MQQKIFALSLHPQGAIKWTVLLQIAVNTCCMAICTFMLGSTFRTFTALLSEEEEAAFMMRCRAFAKGYGPGSKPPAPPRNFRTHWEFFCRAEWQRALCLFTAGHPLLESPPALF